MKYLTLIIVISLHTLLFPIQSFSQSCLPEGIFFTTQAQIDSFLVNYPNCTEIEGDVVINGDDISNLNGVNGLTSIAGNLEISGNPLLISLTGLDSLTSIYGNLEINDNNSLANFPGMDNLISVGGNLEINNNISVESLSGFVNMASIGGDLEIGFNDDMVNIEGMDSLTLIGGGLDIKNNDALSAITGFNFLTSIGGFFSIWNNSDLSGISGFGSLTNIGEYLEIKSNDSLESLSGLSPLTSIAGSISIVENYSLTSLTGLENINAGTIYGLTIHSNTSLSSCEVASVCEYLTTIGGWTNIFDNAPGCNNPEEVIESCDGICLPNGIIFNSQEEIDNFQINHPGCAEIFGGVFINGENISNLDSLNTLTSIWGYLGIGGNPTLTNLSGLENLTSINGSLLIVENDSLNSLASLTNLNTIGGTLNVSNNNALTSLTGLDNVNPASIINLTISYNNSLAECDALSICNYLVNPGGNIQINNNAPGCNSPEEIEEACDTITLIDEEYIHGSFSIFPNPCSGKINLRYMIRDQGLVICDLFGISGVWFKSFLNEVKIPGIYEKKYDLSGLPKGVYFCTLKTDKGIQTTKMIKVE